MSNEHIAEVRKLRKNLQSQTHEKGALQRRLIDLQGEFEALKELANAETREEELEITELRAEKARLVENAAEMATISDTRVRKAGEEQDDIMRTCVCVCVCVCLCVLSKRN